MTLTFGLDLVTVASLREHWETARSKAEQRRTELDDMLAECRQFHNAYADLEQWLAGVEVELDAKPIRPDNQQHVTMLLNQHEVSTHTLLDNYM
jgi:hypothetical protein